MNQRTHENSTVKIGVVLAAPRVPAWAASVLRRIEAAPGLELELVVAVDRAALVDARQAGFSSLLFRLYRWLDYRVCRRKNDALAAMDVGQLRTGDATIHATIEHRDGKARLDPDTLGRIVAAGLDVILDLSVAGLGECLAPCAACGVWASHEGRPEAYRRMPPLIAEMYDKDPVAETVVHGRTASDPETKTLYRGSCATDLKSYCLNRNAAAWNAAEYLIRCLEGLQQHGWKHVIGRDGAGEPDEYDESHVCLPGNLWTVGLLTRMAWRFLGRRLHSLLYHTPWVIAFRMKEPDTESAADRVRFLLPGGNRQFADPFLFRRDERTFLFFEDCPCDSHTGVISCVEIDSAGRTTPVRPVLTADCHLSYPFVFEWQGEIYMLPETSRHRTVELYRAVDFPESWVFDRVLLDNLRAVDPTLLFHEGRYWLFVGTPSANGRMGEELSLYHAETPLGPWSAHPGNPVVNDVRRARPAGRVLRTEAGLIRPGQDHSVRYGYATSLCRIETLSTTEYRERVVGRIDPEGLPQAVCTHTLARDPRFEVIDLRLAVYRGIPWLRRGSAKRDAVLRAWSKVPTAWPNLDLSTSVANCAKMNA